MSLTSRLATQNDISAIKQLISLSMVKLLGDVLTPQQVAKSHTSMGLDTQLIEDRTYFVIEETHMLVGCGGWSRRRTLFGSDNTQGRDDALADPKTEAAKIRAMYTHPAHTRRGIGRMLLELGERAAKAEGFRCVELGATASGILLYEKCGYVAVTDISETDENGITVPNILMRKTLD